MQIEQAQPKRSLIAKTFILLHFFGVYALVSHCQGEDVKDHVIELCHSPVQEVPLLHWRVQRRHLAPLLHLIICQAGVDTGQLKHPRPAEPT